MSDIRNASVEELQAEIERRKAARENKPALLTSPDLREVKMLCTDYIQGASEGYVDEDTKQYIFEATLKAFYGKNVFDWVNKVLR